ncbi:purine nucleoside phosphoramidase [uncultured Roseburia sp.]|nr:purine nucleoside phosphoramidase [uncultured Roseburia sp.]
MRLHVVKMKDETCIFCKLANGSIPTRTIFEDEMFRVILDASPASQGHALILPKEHYANIYEIPEETAAAAMVLAKRLTDKMTKALKCDGFNLVQNNGEAAGQTVFHFHLHLIPRYQGESNGKMLAWEPCSFSDEEMDSVQGLLEDACKMDIQ